MLGLSFLTRQVGDRTFPGPPGGGGLSRGSLAGRVSARSPPAAGTCWDVDTGCQELNLTWAWCEQHPPQGVWPDVGASPLPRSLEGSALGSPVSPCSSVEWATPLGGGCRVCPDPNAQVGPLPSGPGQARGAVWVSCLTPLKGLLCAWLRLQARWASP